MFLKKDTLKGVKHFHVLNFISRKPLSFEKTSFFWPETQLIQNRYHIDPENEVKNNKFCYPFDEISHDALK
jgi:hypothetical protein